MAECAEEMASLLRDDNDNDSGDTVRINVGDFDLKVELIEYKESNSCSSDALRCVAVGFIVVGLLFLYAWLSTYVTDMLVSKGEGYKIAYLGTHM